MSNVTLMAIISVASNGGLDFQEIAGIGVGATILGLLIRTFWRQDSRWDAVLEAERQSAINARDDARVAREEATLARIESADLRKELVATREREQLYLEKVRQLETTLQDYGRQLKAAQIKIQELESRGS